MSIKEKIKSLFKRDKKFVVKFEDGSYLAHINMSNVVTATRDLRHAKKSSYNRAMKNGKLSPCAYFEICEVAWHGFSTYLSTVMMAEVVRGKRHWKFKIVRRH